MLAEINWKCLGDFDYESRVLRLTLQRGARRRRKDTGDWIQ